MRCFIAVALPDAVKAAARQSGEEILGRFLATRLVKPDQMHLTLAFLGEVPVQKVEAVKDASEWVLGAFERMELPVDEVILFESRLGMGHGARHIPAASVRLS